MFDLVWEILLQQLAQVCLYLLPSTRLYPLQIQFSAFFAVQHTAFHQFEAQFVVLQTHLLTVGPLSIADKFLLDVVLFDGFAEEILVELVYVLSKTYFDLVKRFD